MSLYDIPSLICEFFSSDFLSCRSCKSLAARLREVFEDRADKLAATAETSYEKAAWYEILRVSEQAGFHYFRIIVEVTDGTCTRCLAGQGRLFTLDELVMYDLLPPLHPHCRCMVVPADETENSDAWYDPLVRIPADAKRLIDTFVATQQARLGEGTLSGVLDWLTMGLVSGFAQGLGDRWEEMVQSPSPYHTANWLTLGFAGEVRGAVAPEEPLSLEHWLHSIGVVSALYSAYAMGKSAAMEYRQAAELEKMAGELGGSGAKQLENLYDFKNGTKPFDSVIDDYAKAYAEKVKSNTDWSWNKSIVGGEQLSIKQKRLIKERAIKNGCIPEIKVIKVQGMKYGFADFESAGVVKHTVDLPEDMWKLSDSKQFEWLNDTIGGKLEGYTWHHTEVSGKMQLVETGVHNIIAHNGGRTAGMWADAPR